jgi:hypothetical protein
MGRLLRSTVARCLDRGLHFKWIIIFVIRALGVSTHYAKQNRDQFTREDLVP